jgi:hypothetical protein
MTEASPTTSPSTASLIAEGSAALLTGQKARARSLLQIAVRDDPDNVEAWLWLSGTYTRPDEIAYCLRQVLARDPDNAQALEGLAWLAETFDFEPVSRQAPPKTEAVSRPAESDGGLVLIEMGLYVAGVGALLGLLRLASALRPGTLLLLRGDHGAISIGPALGLALASAVLHGLGLVFAWLVLGRNISRARGDRRGDLFDSLVHTAQVFAPGYLTLPALLLAAAGLGWSEQRWIPLAITVWLVLITAVIVGARRFVRTLDAVHVSREHRVVYAARIFVPALLIAMVGLGLSGIAVQALLRML